VGPKWKAEVEWKYFVGAWPCRELLTADAGRNLPLAGCAADGLATFTEDAC